jgi:membrane-associated phospholipid phosphatase
VVAFTRVLFGAHFPLDVLVGAALGYVVGLFARACSRTPACFPSTGARAIEPLPEPASLSGATRP